MSTYPTVRWDEHILVVYSVLAGLAFEQGFSFLATSSVHLGDVVLLVGVFFIVLENWIYLHLYLRVIDVQTTSEVTLYLLASISYSCIPFLYLAQSRQSGIAFTAPQWLLANYLLICFLDSVTKAVTLRKMRVKGFDKLNEDEHRLVGTYFFYAVTGMLYTVILLVVILLVPVKTWDPTVQAIAVVAIWVFIRIVDRYVIPRTADGLARLWGTSQIAP